MRQMFLYIQMYGQLFQQPAEVKLYIVQQLFLVQAHIM